MPRGERHSKKMRSICIQGRGPAKLRPDQVSEIRAKYVFRKYTAVMLAREFGTSRTNVYDILRRRIWRDVR
jgi:DNA invertase Pin-like site-specific DNA recombinase